MWMSNKALLSGLPAFNRIAPKPKSILPRPVRSVIKFFNNAETIMRVAAGDIKISDVIAHSLVGSAVNVVMSKPFKKTLVDAGGSTMILKNGFNGYSWFKERKNEAERQVQNMVVVFHDADRAGRHIDVHIGNVSFVVRIPNDQAGIVQVGRKGLLTKASQKSILGFLRDHIAAGKHIPQNLDHSPTNARMQWKSGGKGIDGYGAGKIRQVILEEPVEVFSTDGETSKIYAPSLNKDFNLYFHRLGKTVAVGPMKGDPPALKPKLSLKMVDDLDAFLKKVDPNTLTLKEDAAAAYIVETPKGSTIWSPRISKETGRRIEYTGKVPELAAMRGNFIGIGELKFRRPDGSYLNSSETGGVLNSDKIRPHDLKPELFLYRADKIDGQDVSNLGFFSNREIQEGQTNDFIKLVKLVSPDCNEGEGLVGVAPGGSINDGFKKKWSADPDDWEVIRNDLRYGPTGRTAGTVRFRSHSSGREFKLGPGQIGTEKRVKEWMSDNNLVGRVAKVMSRRGHEGRAARFVEWHTDK